MKKKKKRFPLKKGPNTNELQNDILACVDLQFNGFEITRYMSNKDQQHNFEAVDIVYQPVTCVGDITVLLD